MQLLKYSFSEYCLGVFLYKLTASTMTESICSSPPKCISMTISGICSASASSSASLFLRSRQRPIKKVKDGSSIDINMSLWTREKSISKHIGRMTAMHTTIAARAVEAAISNRRLETTACCRALAEIPDRANARPAAGQNITTGGGTCEMSCTGNTVRLGRKSAPDSGTRKPRTVHM